GLWLVVDVQPGAALFEPDPGPVGGLDGDGPSFALVAAPYEARRQRAICLRAGEHDLGRDRRRRVTRHAELRRTDEQPAGENLCRDREGVDSRIEHAEAARLPDPLLARVPLPDILMPADG